MTAFTITLRATAHACTARNSAAMKMDNQTLYLSHLPRVGDFIRDGDYGTIEVKKVIFDSQNRGITLEIE